MPTSFLATPSREETEDFIDVGVQAPEKVSNAVQKPGVSRQTPKAANCFSFGQSVMPAAVIAAEAGAAVSWAWAEMEENRTGAGRTESGGMRPEDCLKRVGMQPRAALGAVSKGVRLRCPQTAASSEN
jgi:hypothetical protein